MITCERCGMRSSFARALCHGCWSAARRSGTLPPRKHDRVSAEDRFWSRVKKSDEIDGCWEWTAGRTSQGYGHFQVNGVIHKTHRYAYEMANGPIPPGLFACHRCDNPPCVRPDHIFLGTNRDNQIDSRDKGRNRPARGQAAGSALTEKEVIDIRSRAPFSMIKDLAAAFGVGPWTISRVIKRQIWKYVPRNRYQERADEAPPNPQRERAPRGVALP